MTDVEGESGVPAGVRLRVLLLSAYDTPSHRYWSVSLQRQLDHIDWTYLSLPGRYFSWRIRGNSLTWSLTEAERLSARYDLVLATSMTDVATLRGLCPALAQTPTVVYFHENQFVYPQSAAAHRSVEPQMVTLYSALCADCVVFNSHYNRRTFMHGVAEMLGKMPDLVPPGVVDLLEQKALVLPVPVDGRARRKSLAPVHLPLQLVWNHRWEYDKGPRLLLDCLQSLPAQCSLCVHVVGQQFRRQPEEFALIHELLVQRGWLGQWGFIEQREQYFQLLQGCHAVLSTAEHEFQGLAVLEAVAAGCVPLVPNKLAYPETFGEAYCYSVAANAGAALAEKILQLQEQIARGHKPAVPAIDALMWPSLKPVYQSLLDRIASRNGASGGAHV